MDDMEHFLDLFTEQVRRFPLATAASDGQDRLSYRELDEITDGFARMLGAASVKRGDIVAIGLERGLGFLVSMIGLFKVGAAYLPLDRALPLDRRAYMLEQCACRWLIQEPDGQAQFDGVASLRMPERFEGMAGGAAPERVVLADDSLAYVIFTSGSTGMPKGAMVHHGGMVNHLLAKVEDLDMRRTPNVAQTAPQSFDISVWQFLAPLVCAGRTAILTRAEFLDLERLGSRIVQDEIDILQVVPSHLLAILDAIVTDTDNSRFDRLACLVATGEVLPVSLARRWLAIKPHVPLVNAYGPTECSDDVTHQVIVQMPRADQAIPIGRAVRGVRLTVRDADRRVLPVGETGELYVEGIAVGLGYIGRPDLTEKAFVTLDGGRAYKTGDLASCDSEGVFHYHGRTDDQVKVRGHRIELSEVEFGIRRLAQVKQAAVVLNTAQGRAFLTAFIVVHDGASADPEPLRLQLREHLPEHMIPSEFRVVPCLPETPNGKIDKKRLAAIANDTPSAVVSPAAAEKDARDGRELLDVWRELLRNPALQPADDVFRQGADSILALQFIARAKVLGHVFTLGDVFRNPTAAGLLKAVRAKDSAPLPSGAGRQCEAEQAEALSRLSPAQRGIFVQSLRARHRNTYVLQYSFRMTLPDAGKSLEAGWRKVHERHELLRSAFVLGASGQPVRRVVPDAPLSWTDTDLSSMDEPGQRNRLEAFLDEDRQAGFALDRPALYRLHLFSLGGADYQFVLSAHHLIMDGASVFPLMSEALGAVPASVDAYASYIADQEKFRLGEQDRSLWAELLEPVRAATLVSDGLAEPSLAPVRHACSQKRLPAELVQAIGEIGLRAGTTVSAVAATAWAMALNAACGGQDQLFGMIVSGRAETGVGLNDVGMYANTLPLPVTLHPSGRPEANLQQVARRIARLLRFESASMSEVLAGTRARLGHEAFDTALNVETLADWTALEGAGTGVARVELTHVTDLTEFPFAVEVLGSADGITVDFIRDPERVSEARAAELSEQFLSALAYLCHADEPLERWQGWKGQPASVGAPSVAGAQPEPERVRSSFDETVLAAVSDILGDGSLALHHNFFSRGGDSISALQLIARLRREALVVDLDRIFASRSLADIAHAVRCLDGRHDATRHAPTGPTALVPVQRWFAEQVWANADHWCLGTAIEIRRSLRMDDLASATRTVLERYPVLGARFNAADGYAQTIPESPVHVPACCTAVTLDDGVERSQDVIRETLNRTMASLDLAAGDLFRTVLFRTPEGAADLLVVLAHHLVVDAVSLRILVEDILHVCAGGNVPAQATPMRHWAQQLAGEGQSLSDEILAQTAYWSSVVGAIPASMPFEPHRQACGRIRTVSGGLSLEATSALLRDVPAAYDTRINDILVSALVRAFSGWRGKADLAINLEGHGREGVLEGVDISRTVGWFTSVFPVCLHDPQDGPASLIQQTKRTLAQIPQRGIGYGMLRYLRKEAAVIPPVEPMVQFNYLGQWDNVSFDDPDVSMPSAAILSLIDQASVDPRNRRQHALEIEARIVQGRLETDWHFDEGVVSSGEAQAFVQRYCAALNALIDHCRSGVMVRAPSDYPDADLTADELKGLIDTAGAVPTEIYPLSASQKGILFQHLVSDDDVYILQYVLDIAGEIDPALLEAAWRVVAGRHPILRSGFCWDAVAGPVQYVLQSDRSVWSIVAGSTDPAALERLMASERSHGFDLGTPALTRFALLSDGGQAHRLIWTYHHILMDGWCVARVIKELFGAYDQLVRGDRPEPAFGRVYRDYIQWLTRQGPREHRPFWKGYLAGVRPCLYSSPVAYRPAGHDARHVHRFTLGRDLSRRIEGFCTEHGVTVAVAFQWIWAQVLAQGTGNLTPVFGWAISGRPADLEGAEQIIGLMTSVVPCKVDVAAPLSGAGIRGLQRSNAALQEEGHVSMSHFKAAAGLTQEEELFNTVLVIENFELQDNLPAGERYRVNRLEWVERSEFPLVLGVIPSDDVLIELNFDRERFCVAQMADLQERIVLEADRLSSLGNGYLEHDASLRCESVS